jgi:hypothetical protein
VLPGSGKLSTGVGGVHGVDQLFTTQNHLIPLQASVHSYEAAMKSLLARSRTQVKPTTLRNAIPTASRSIKPPTRPPLRAYHAHPSTSGVSTVIDPSTFPITKGYSPPIDGRPHFKKVLIANRYVPHLF